ncbi:MAG TPA: SRPBCC family protein [Pyrinomonadaceae bacterium]|nr:SRPBCC family protein [Pyrinomonadaceae bacterium]
MATATKKQAQGGQRQGNAGQQSAQSSSPDSRQTGQTTDGTLPAIRHHAGQSGGLMNINAEQLARGLGWFSIGLGLAELLAPRGIAKVAGVRGHTGLIRLFGLREIFHGIGIFSQGRRPAAAVWARVAGDALDLAALGGAFASPRSDKARVAFATANVLAVTALDVICAQQLSSGNSDSTAGGGTTVRKSLIINRSPEELYSYWRNFENLPRFMHHLESVRVTGEGRSHWVAKAPAGSSVEWDAEIVEDRPNELISWRSLEGADVDNSGSVRFETAPGGRGTIVRVEMQYNPPGGVIGAVVAKLFGEEPGQQAQESLRCFKQVMETGEVVLSEGTVWDNGYLTQRPAQPPSGAELGAARAGGRA